MSQSNVSESKNRRKEHLIIKFTDLADRDVQKNDLINDSDYGSGTVYGEKDYLEQFEKSAFRYIYSQAFSQVHQIVMQSKNTNDSKGRTKKEIFDIDNTIAFTGRKGTGKTSAMLSFANFLDRHPLRLEDNGNENHDVKFVKICEIDVSYFRSNNDIFVQFLSEIADTLNQRIQEEKYKFNNSQLEQTKMLRERVHKILSDYLSISANDSLNDYDSSYSFMKKIADRQKVEKEFANFMKEFQKWYLSDRQFYGEIYFIVCIDDVDMSSNPEEIVAAIHKYFMVPQLIVFMTAETDALTSEVQKQFYDRLCPIEDKGRQERMSMKQTRDYLSKILPTDNRITMPSWKKKEYMELFPYYVTFGKNDKDKLDELKKQYPKLITDKSEFYKFLNLPEYKEKEFWRTPKEFIFMMIANRTKCYLSITGSKYHLMEPDSLRNMYILFYLLYGMHNIVEEYEHRKDENNEYYIHRAENRKQLFDYIFFTKRKEMIFAEGEEEFLDKLFIYPIERRGRMIWDQYYEKLTQKEHAERVKALYGVEFFEDQNARHKDEYYSYGELFRVLYVSTRCGIFSRDFIRFLLTAFSFILPPFVENEKMRNNDKFKDDEFVKPSNDFEKMLAFYGHSFLGTWWNDLIGWDKKTVFSANLYSLKIKIMELLSFTQKKEQQESKDTKEIIKNVQEIIEEFVEPFILLILCTTDFIESTASFFAVADQKQYKKRDEMPIGFHNRIFDFEPTAYFMNVLYLGKYSDDSIQTVFYSLFLKMLEELEFNPASTSLWGVRNEIITKETKNKIRKKVVSVLNDVMEDYYQKNHLSNLFKHTDLMYNVLKKHMIKKLYLSSTTPIIQKVNLGYDNEELQLDEWQVDGKKIDRDVKTIYIAAKRFYQDLASELKKQDEKYFSECKAKVSDPCFSVRLERSVIYRFFVEEEYKKARQWGSDFLSNAAAAMAGGEKTSNGKRRLLTVLEDVFEPFTTYRRGVTELKSILNVTLDQYMDYYVSERVADAITNEIVLYSFQWQRAFDPLKNRTNSEEQPRDSVSSERVELLEGKALMIAERIKMMVKTGHVPGDDD